MSTCDPLRSCRFCLRLPTTTSIQFRRLSATELAASDIPGLFETVTAIKLDLGDGYSPFLCANCEQRMRAAAETRRDFRRVAQQWQLILGAGVKLEEEVGDEGGYASVAKEDDGHNGVDISAKFVECELGDEGGDGGGRNTVKQEHEADPTQSDEDEDDDHRMEVPQGFDSSSSSSGSGSDADSDEYRPPAAAPVGRKNSRQSRRTEGSAKLARESEAKEPSPAPVKKRRGPRPLYGKPPNGQTLTCDICQSQLSCRAVLIAHMRKIHINKPAGTAGSTTGTSGSGPGSRSARKSYDPTSTTCHICGKTNLKSIFHHMRDHERADKFKCSYCPKTFSRAVMHRQHERTHTGERPFICEVCGFSFTSPPGLLRHTQLRHSQNAQQAAAISNKPQRPQKQQIVRLRVLPPSADQAAALLKKLPLVQTVRLQCPLCPNTYSSRQSLQPHMKIQHGAGGIAAWKQFLATVCGTCNERFADAEQLAAHRPQHQPYQCEICMRRFEQKITWELHVQKHAKIERRFKCEECGAAFPCSFTLRMHHRRAHTDYRPFVCPHCGFGFAEHAHMMAHMRKMHTMAKVQRQHVCGLCPAGTPGFQTAETLRSHMENHTGRFRYQCGVCGRNQHSSSLLVQHMQSFHPVEWRAEEEEKRREVAEEAARKRAAAEAAAEVGELAGNGGEGGQLQQQQQQQQQQVVGATEVGVGLGAIVGMGMGVVGGGGGGGGVL